SRGEKMKVVFAHGEVTPQDWRIFTASERRTIETDHSLTREFGPYGALGIVVRCIAHRHVAKLSLAIQIHSQRQRALIFQRKLAARIFSRSVQPQRISGHVDYGVVKERDRSW